MCQSIIFLKIVIIASSSNSLMETMLKWRINLGVTGFRPPPVNRIKQHFNGTEHIYYILRHFQQEWQHLWFPILHFWTPNPFWKASTSKQKNFFQRADPIIKGREKTFWQSLWKCIRSLKANGYIWAGPSKKCAFYMRKKRRFRSSCEFVKMSSSPLLSIHTFCSSQWLHECAGWSGLSCPYMPKVTFLYARYFSFRPRGYKHFFMLNSAEHGICHANKSQITNNCKFFLAKHSWVWDFLC